MFKLLAGILVASIAVNYTSATFAGRGIGESLLNGLIGGLVPPGSLGIGQGGGVYGGRCPLCDSSVFEYCSHKLLHDACCCNGGIGIPYDCRIADCSYLNSNSCYEHSLIATCCCNNLYQYQQ